MSLVVSAICFLVSDPLRKIDDRQDDEDENENSADAVAHGGDCFLVVQ